MGISVMSVSWVIVPELVPGKGIGLAVFTNFIV